MKRKQLFYLVFLMMLGFSVNAQTGSDSNTVYGYDTLNPFNALTPSIKINNTYFGFRINRGYANIGSENSAVGYLAFYQPKDASRNNCFGSRSGYSNQLGNDNVLFGAFSGYTNFSGGDNVNIGSYSGYTSYDKSYNVFVGGNSGRLNVTDGNTFIGYDSGAVNSSGNQNVFFGYGSGAANTLGSNNTFLGYEAGRSNVGTVGSPGNSNTFIGNMTGRSNTTGNSNVLIGSETGRYANGSYNICVGQFTGLSTTGTSNVFIGHGAGQSATTATANVFIGHQAGLNNSTGVGNVFLGPRIGELTPGATTPYTNANDKLLIGRYYNLNPAEVPLIYGDFLGRKLGIGFRSTFAPTRPDGFPITSGTPTGGGSPVDVSAYKLFVDGGILSTAITVSTFANWADYVFASDYQLKSLDEVEKFIKENGHLQNIPSAQEIAESGFELSNMARLQQEKIEELTLYLIQQNKEIQELKKQNAEIAELKEQLKTLINKKG